MTSHIAGNAEAQSLVDSAITMFTNVFAGSSAFFITSGLLILITRILVRLGTSNYRSAFTESQRATVYLLFGILGIAHFMLSLFYATNEGHDSPTAPSFYWAACWSMATLSGICGGLGVGLVVFVVVTGGF
ncbi:hypothetical protein D6D13_09408 [Aureobasidium pullulans]|uniref:Uncharacterized protein n=1 Tax=Aureobasidium pullulans TaxID=5580 RepID=A0A4S9QE98_AURPU|nr:hypothetical protein D6D13_09408 [Aureobasidium pullulans]THY82583.1 hypothetical protein D6C92_09976 [Aureobasidium pullulans]